MKNNWLSILGAVASLLGVSATLVSKWVDDRKTEAMIDEKINEALAEKNEETEEEEES